MPKFTVIIEETVSQDFDIEANSQEEAIKIARDKYRNGEFVLEPGNLELAQVMLYNGNMAKTEKM